MARTYSDYISVDTDFIPVFSAFSDRDFPTKWKSFFPHDSFKTILNHLIETLEMSSVEKNKPVWMYGAYGTGKTFASFVIKHLLEDDLTFAREYCETNKMMPLFARLQGVRAKGKTIVVHRSSSADVNGQNKLFNIIIESVKEALKKNDCQYFGQKSRYDIVLSTLKDPLSAFNFDKAFDRHKLKFEGYASAASVVRDLETLPSEEQYDLLETIIEVAEAENYNWSTSVGDVIAWLDDVVKTNNLHAIVFIWDEFTEFFKNNQSNLTGLQEIAQASATIRFYFFLITHLSVEIIHDQVARRVIEARFKCPAIEMAETTAFMLMGQAIKHEPDLAMEWERVNEDLWARVEKQTRKTILSLSSDTKETEIKRLLPFHPYAAYLLKVISRTISSNQRTMFQFISGDYGGEDDPKTNFRWFIDRHSNALNEWNFLTADLIWNYFFTEENPDLDAVFRTAMGQYNNYASLCGNDSNKERILKVVLLLSAMQQVMGGARTQGATKLLRPTLSNIAFAFVGTPNESLVEQTMSWFVQKQIFGKIDEDGDVLYVPPAGQIDQERWDRLRQEVAQQVTFEKILTDYDIAKDFKPDGYLQARCEIFSVTTRDYQNAENQALALSPNKIPVFFMFAKDETERAKAKTIVERIVKNSNGRLVIVDFSEEVLTAVSFDKFIDEKTYERYYTGNPNYSNQLNVAKQNAQNIIAEWKRKLATAILHIYPQLSAGAPQETRKNNLKRRLQEINESKFGCGLETISVNDRLFSATGFKETLPQMAMSKVTIPANFAYVREISNKLSNEQIWNDPKYWENKPNHAVSKMKIRLEEVISSGFEKDRRVAITEIWHALEQPPFGLFTCQGAAFLLGFLLKEYADSMYYKNDGANTVPLNYTDLSSLIDAAVKGLPKAENQYIVKQKPEHIEFCQISGEIFRIAKDKRNSVDDVGKNISVFLSQNRLPLWSLKSYLENEFTDVEEANQAIDLYCEFVSTTPAIGRDRLTIADELYIVFKNHPSLKGFLMDKNKIENMKKGMEYYIAENKPEVIQLIRRLGIEMQEFLQRLIEKLSPDSSYLWQIGDTKKQIDSLYLDYKLIDSLNNLIPEKKRSKEEARRALAQRFEMIKIPSALIMQEYPRLKTLFEHTHRIISGESIDTENVITTLDELSQDFVDLFKSQNQIFTKVLRKIFDFPIADEEMNYLFSNLPGNIISFSEDQFSTLIKRNLDEYRKTKKINQLYQAWEIRTGTKNPEAWSRKNLLPIICLFQKDNNEALFTFNLINQHSGSTVDERLIDKAIEYVRSEELDVLENLTACNQIFLQTFARDYACIIDDVEDLKKTIATEVGLDADKWMTAQRKLLDNCIEHYAKHQYDAVYKHKVKDKIRLLSPERAQEYLSELIEDKPLVGINILMDNR